jgi:hypothetical protein
MVSQAEIREKGNNAVVSVYLRCGDVWKAAEVLERKYHSIEAIQK